MIKIISLLILTLTAINCVNKDFADIIGDLVVTLDSIPPNQTYKDFVYTFQDQSNSYNLSLTNITGNKYFSGYSQPGRFKALATYNIVRNFQVFLNANATITIDTPLSKKQVNESVTIAVSKKF